MKEASSHAVGQLCEADTVRKDNNMAAASLGDDRTEQVDLFASSPYSPSQPSEEATAWVTPDNTHEKTRFRGTTLGMLWKGKCILV